MGQSLQTAIQNKRKQLLEAEEHCEVIRSEIAVLEEALAIVDGTSDSSSKSGPSRSDLTLERENIVVAFLRQQGGEARYTDIADHLKIKPNTAKVWLVDQVNRKGEDCKWTFGMTKSWIKLKPLNKSEGARNFEIKSPSFTISDSDFKRGLISFTEEMEKSKKAFEEFNNERKKIGLSEIIWNHESSYPPPN